MLVVTVMKLVGVFDPQLAADASYLRLDVMVVCFIAGAGALYRGWRWAFWVALARETRP